MQYLILAYETDGAFEARDDPDRAGAYWGAWSGYPAPLRPEQRVRVGGLRPAQAQPPCACATGSACCRTARSLTARSTLGATSLSTSPTSMLRW